MEKYVYRIIIDGKMKEFENKEDLINYLERELHHPCGFLSIKSFHPTENLIMKMGIIIRR